MVSESFRWGAYRQLSARERDVFDYMLKFSTGNIYDYGQRSTAEALCISLGTVKDAFSKLLGMDAIVINGRTTRCGFERVFINPHFARSESFPNDLRSLAGLKSSWSDALNVASDKKAHGL